MPGSVSDSYDGPAGPLWDAAREAMDDFVQGSQPFDRKAAAQHVLLIMGGSSPTVKRLAESVLAEPEWTQTPPTLTGTYWWWNGERGVSPCPLFVAGEHNGRPAFVQISQLGLTQATDCATWGGWWKPLPDPELPTGE